MSPTRRKQQQQQQQLNTSLLRVVAWTSSIDSIAITTTHVISLTWHRNWQFKSTDGQMVITTTYNESLIEPPYSWSQRLFIAFNIECTVQRSVVNHWIKISYEQGISNSNDKVILKSIHKLLSIHIMIKQSSISSSKFMFCFIWIVFEINFIARGNYQLKPPCQEICCIIQWSGKAWKTTFGKRFCVFEPHP